MNRESDQSKRDSAMMNNTFYHLHLEQSFTAHPSKDDDKIFIQWPSGIVAVDSLKFAEWMLKKRPSRATIIAMLQRKKEQTK